MSILSQSQSLRLQTTGLGGRVPQAHPRVLTKRAWMLRRESFLGCQLQQFLRGDGRSRRAKAGFRETHLLPGCERRVGRSLPVRPGPVSGRGVAVRLSGNHFAGSRKYSFPGWQKRLGRHQAVLIIGTAEVSVLENAAGGRGLC